MIKKILNKFLNKKFLTFCLIGGIAYIVHQFVYLFYIKITNLWDDKNHLLSTAIAFTFASIFSYFLNTKLTYKENPTKETGIKSALVFAIKFIITEAITISVMTIARKRLDETKLMFKCIDLMLPLILTTITLIFQFVAFNIIFKTKEEEESDGKRREE